MGADVKDNLFGSAAVKLGFISRDQLQECLQIQEQMRKMGLDSPIGEILVKKGYLTPAQQTQILKALGVDINLLPGYQILHKIGQGGMGCVYKARHLKMDRLVAIKLIDDRLAKEPGFVERFLREARAAAKLAHPNIVAAYDVGEHDGIYFFVMEFVEGRPLSAIMKAEKIDAKRAARWMLQAAEALDFVSKNGLIHRDIKPENLMVTADGSIKILDFGLAKSVGQSDVALTQTGFLMGTPLYMSPEQIRGEKNLDIRSDLYSLGASFYHVLAGRPPFPGQTPNEILSKHLTQPPTPLRQLNPDLPESLAAIVHKCLAKDRARRYATASELAQDLRRFLAGERPAAARAWTERKAPPRRKRRWTILAAAAAGVLALMAVVVLPQPSGPSPVTPGPNPQPSSEEISAAQVWAEAQLARSRSDWRKAVELATRLTREFHGTQTVAKHYEEIAKLIAECNAELDRQKRGRDEAVARVRTHMQLGEWKEAQQVLRSLGSHSDDEILKLAKACAAEIAFQEAYARAKALHDAGDWARAVEAYEDLIQQHGSTASAGQLRATIEEDLRLCRLELEAMADINRARALPVEKRWTELLNLLRQLETSASKTRSYLAAAGELRELKRQAMQALQQELRQAAEQHWSDALAAWNRGAYEEARKRFEEYRESYRDAEFFPSRQVEVEKYLSLCDQKLKEQRQQQAAARWSHALELASARNYEQALEVLQQLQEMFGDTEYVRNNAAAIKAKIAEVEKALAAIPVRVVLDDFDSSPLRWKPTPQSYRGFAVTPHRDDRTGRSFMRLHFPGLEKSATQAYACSALFLPGGLPASTEAISVSVKLLKGDRMTLAVELFVPAPAGSPKDFAHFRAKIIATPQWETRTVKISDFQCLTPELEVTLSDPTRVVGIGLARSDYPGFPVVSTENDIAKEFILAADDLVALVKRSATTTGKVKMSWDFETGLSGWVPGYRPASVAHLKNGDRNGKGALHILMPSRSAQDSVTTRQVGVNVSSLGTDAAGFSFWVKLVRGTRATLALDVTIQGGNSFRHMFEASDQWKQVTVMLADLRPRGSHSVLDPGSVTRISLSRHDSLGIAAPDQRTYTGNDPNLDLDFLLDEFELLTRNGRTKLYDFDTGLNGWSAPVAFESAKLELVESDRTGKTVLKATLPGKTDGACPFGIPLAGLPQDAQSIRFWIKTPAAEHFTLLLEIAEHDGGRTSFYRARVDVPPRWEQVTIPFASLQRVEDGATGAHLKRPGVIGLSFLRYDSTAGQRPLITSGNDPSRDLMVLLDDVQVLGRR